MKGGEILINKVILAGRIATDVDMKNFSETLQIATFSIAVDRGKKKSNKESTVDFLKCKAFNRTAQNIHSYCKKGNLVCVTGQIHNNRYEKDGAYKYSVEIVVESIKFLPNFSSNKDKSPDEQWNELSLDEKHIVIGDYITARRMKAQQQSEVAQADHTSSTRTQWVNKINNDQSSEEVSKEIEAEAEQIASRFSGELTKENENSDQDETIKESDDSSESNEVQNTDSTITETNVPF